MTKRRATGATACWFLLSSGLAVVITMQLNSELSLTSPVTAAPSGALRAGEEEPAEPLVGHLSEDLMDMIVDRPLFSLSRRPFTAPVVEDTVKAPPPARTLSVKLAGTMLSGPSRMALFTHPAKGKLRLREGQEVEGWMIKEVRDDEVRLEHGDEVMLLRLRKGVAPKVKPAIAKSAKPASSEDKQEAAGNQAGAQPAASQ